MVTRVKLEGLNIVRPRGKWYVYHRETGENLIKGFEGTKDDLERRLGEPDILAKYQASRKRDLKRTYPDQTLGWLIQWFENDCAEYAKLSEATKRDYTAAFLWLAPAWMAPLNSITQPDIYDLRDRCAKEKWPRFADKMVAAISSMFTRAVKRGKMPSNPAIGIDKGKANPNANREWSADEWQAILTAPRHILTPIMLARYAGFRGQTIAKLQWKNYQPDPAYGKCLRTTARKNNEMTWIPAVPELQAHLDGLERTSVHIATRHDGISWASELQMQTAVSHHLARMKKAGKIGEGATLHGLRVTYAAAMRRDGVATADVAAALGDRSERMGAHYTRHVEAEAKVIRAFGLGKGR